MGDKTLILKVDLECSRCRKEIGRILGKLQGKENIRTIIYDEKNNTVTISGPFDPEKLSAKLSCRAGKVIKDIKEKEPPKESKPAKAEEKPKKEEKPAEQPKKEEKNPENEKKPEKDGKPAEKKPEKDVKPAEKKPEKDEKPAKSESEVPKKSEPAPAPFAYPQPTCCPTPYYEGYYGGCRCIMCGHIFGYTMAPPYGSYYPPPYDGYRVYHISSEEDPSAATCTIM